MRTPFRLVSATQLGLNTNLFTTLLRRGPLSSLPEVEQLTVPRVHFR